MTFNRFFTALTSFVAEILACGLAEAVEQPNAHPDQKAFFKSELYISSSQMPVEEIAGRLPNQADPLTELQREGWKIVQDGVLRRDLRINEIETFVFGEAGFSWKLQDLQAQLQVLRREFQAHPTPELRRAIASHRKLIASTLKLIERARATDASGGTTVFKTGCTSTFSYHANASYKTDRQGTWADAVAEFNAPAGCNSSGEVYAYAFAQTTVNGATSTATVTDGPRSGSNVNAGADAARNGGSPCESYAYASVTSDSLSPTSYSISQTNNQCPAPAVWVSWVSVNGNDTDDCSRATPCRTFSGALGKVSPGGQINILDSGDFGPVTINKSVSLLSAGTLGGIQVGTGTAITINIGANDKVMLRGLTIDGVGTGSNGISFVSGGSLYIEGCTINNFVQYGIDFSPASGSGKLFVIESAVRNNGASGVGGGIWIRPIGNGSAKAFLTHVGLENNNFGLRADGGGSTGGINVTVKDGSASGNTNASIIAVTGTTVTQVMVNGTTISNNGFGPRADGTAAILRFSDATVSGNGTGLSTANGGTLQSYGNNQVDGNTVDGSAAAIPTK
jgi:hypothetical protein